MKTSIVILTYNNSHLTKQCIESIRKYTKESDYELIIVDNNSTDDTVEYLKSQDDLICIFNEENKGFAGGCNQGIDMSSGDNILLLNNDIIVTPNWLDNMVIALYSENSVGAVGPVTNFCSNFQQIDLPVTPHMNTDEFFSIFNTSNSVKWEERLRLIGFCMLIKKEVVDKIGNLDELFAMGNYEDDDYSLRIRKSGYRLLLCKDTFIFHIGSASFSQLQWERYNNLLNENREKFIKKWNVDPNHIMPIRKDITNLIKEYNKEELSLLYIGCSSCSNLLDIKNELPNSKLYGIEPNEDLVINVAHFAEVKIGIEERIKEFEEKYFDYIIVDYTSPNINNFDIDFVDVVKNYINDDGHIFMILPITLYNEFNAIVENVRVKVFPQFNTLKPQAFYTELQINISK